MSRLVVAWSQLPTNDRSRDAGGHDPAVCQAKRPSHEHERERDLQVDEVAIDQIAHHVHNPPDVDLNI